MIYITKRKLERQLFEAIKADLEDSIVKSRVLYLLQWYNKKASSYKRQTYFATSVSILIPAMVTLLNSGLLETEEMARIPTLILSFFSTVGAGLYAFLRSKDQWIRYRITAESLKRETIYFLSEKKTNPGQYTEDAFIKKIEDIAMAEANEWHGLRSSNKQEDT